jgi:hypothetical protein
MSNEIQGTFFTQKELVKARDWKTLAMILRQAQLCLQIGCYGGSEFMILITDQHRKQAICLNR